MSKNNLVTFEALKAEMKIKGIRQQEVSNHLGVGNNHLWKTIKKGTVRIETLQAICDFLNLELYLVNPEKETETPLT